MANVSTPESSRLLILTTTGTELALCTSDPGVGGTISGEVSRSGTGYARMTTSRWNTPSSNARTNDGVITFPTGTGSWGTVSHWALVAASGEADAGTVRWSDVCRDSRGNTVTKTVGIDDTFTVPDRGLSVRIA